MLERARAEAWSALAGAAGRTLVLDVPADPPTAAATEAVLRQVLDVLVSNAVEHGAGTVRVAAREASGGLAVEVSDEGPGFGPALRTAFDRGNPHARGTGIGLSLARSLAESVGGRLVVSSPRPGPTVTLLLTRWRPERAG